jgi:hypothetical protein
MRAENLEEDGRCLFQGTLPAFVVRLRKVIKILVRVKCRPSKVRIQCLLNIALLL